MNNGTSAEELYRLLHQRPFHPFRIHLDDGRSFDLRHPDSNMVLRDTLVVGVMPRGDDPDPIPDFFEWVYIPHIRRLEPQPPVSSSGS